MNCAERYRIAPDGTVVTVYTDTIDLRALGHVRALRASVVEWDECGQAWTAGLAVLPGPPADSGEADGPRWPRLRGVLLAYLFGAALSAFFWLPAAAESRAVQHCSNKMVRQTHAGPLSYDLKSNIQVS